MHIIIVLGAQNDGHGNLSSMAIARAQGALREYRQLCQARFLLTGGYGWFNRAPKPHAHYVARYLVEQGVAAHDILALVESAHTVEDAALAQDVLDSLPVHAVSVVTSEFHAPRARLIFEHFVDPDTLTMVGTPNAVSPERLQAWQAHEIEQIERIHQQDGVIYQSRLIQRRT